MTKIIVCLSTFLLCTRAFVPQPAAISFIDGKTSGSQTAMISLPERPTGDVIVKLTASEGVIVEPCQIRMTPTSWQNQTYVVTPNFRYNASVSNNRFMNSTIEIATIYSDEAKFRSRSVSIPVSRQLQDPQLCLSNGDPHYVSLDGVKFDFHGIGVYDLHKSPEIIVQQRNYRCAGTSAAPLTCSDAIAIQYKNSKRVFVYANHSTADMSKIQPIQGATFITPPTNDTVQMKFDNGAVLLFRFFLWKEQQNTPYTYVQLSVPGKHAGVSQGICGNYNGDAKDDATNNFSIASCNLFDDNTASCPYNSQQLLNQPTCRENFPRLVVTTTTSVFSAKPTSDHVKTSAVSTKTTPTVLGRSTQPTATTISGAMTRQISVSNTPTVITPAATSPIMRVSSQVENFREIVTTFAASSIVSTIKETPSPTKTATTTPQSTGTLTDVGQAVSNEACPQLTYRVAREFCAQVLKTLPGSYDKNNFHVEACACDSVIRCDATSTAQDTFIAFQHQVFLHAYVLIQSPSKTKCDEGKKLIESYYPQVKLDPKPNGGYEIAKNSSIIQTCKTGYGGLNCKQNLKDLLGSILDSFSAGERIHGSFVLAIAAAALFAFY